MCLSDRTVVCFGREPLTAKVGLTTCSWGLLKNCRLSHAPAFRFAALVLVCALAPFTVKGTKPKRNALFCFWLLTAGIEGLQAALLLLRRLL